MVTLFVPLAPNPVMGGFLIHASRDRIFDVDMTVEEAARALVTSGIAAGDADAIERARSNPLQPVGGIRSVDDLMDNVPTSIGRGDAPDDDRD